LECEGFSRKSEEVIQELEKCQIDLAVISEKRNENLFGIRKSVNHIIRSSKITNRKIKI
jgi:hypothetical protein